VYRIRMDSNGVAELLSSDDTYRHVSEEPPPGGSLDDPARMIGNGAVSVPNIEQVDLGCDEVLLLCSDGIHKHVDAREIGRVLRESAPLARRCLRLVEAARQNGSQDDATVLAVLLQKPRTRLARYAAGLLFALAAALLILVWPDAPDPW